MYWISHDFFWIWFYIILFALVYMIHKKRILLVLPLIALMILASDQSTNLAKHSFKRYRPCHNQNLQNEVHVNGSCGGKYGFVSSHASNTFALALFLSMLLAKRFHYFPLLIFSWAVLVSYSRIYNGVHYPADIAGGAVLGIAVGIMTWRLWQIISKRFIQKNVS